MVVVDVEPQSMRWERLKQCQSDAAMGTMAQCMAAFLRWAAQRYVTIKAEMNKPVPQPPSELEMTGSHKRTPINIAKLSTGLDVFLRFAKDTGALSVTESEAVWQRGLAALRKVANAQGEHQASYEPAHRFIELIRSALGSGRAHVASESSDEPKNSAIWGWRMDTGSSLRRCGECIGWLDGLDLYLDPDASFAVAQGVARDIGDPINVSPRTLHKRLRDRGLLASTENKRGTMTVRKMIAGRRQTLLHFNSVTVMPTQTAQTAQTARDDDDHEEDESDSGQFAGQFTPTATTETAQSNCPIPVSSGTTNQPMGKLGSLGSSSTHNSGSNTTESDVAEYIVGQLSNRPLPLIVGPGQTVKDIGGFARAQAKAVLSGSEAIARPARERLANLGVELGNAGVNEASQKGPRT